MVTGAWPPHETSSTYQRARWIDLIAAFGAFAGLLVSVFMDFHVRVRQNAASDIKTLYASAWCYSHGIDGYRLDTISDVFTANGIVRPVSWYAHAPVYPPFTLFALAPLTALPMVPAICVWIALCALLMMCAVWALTDRAAKDYNLSWPWRLALVGLAAADPLISFGLEVGNVSIAVAALCILSVAPAGRRGLWMRAAALTLAMLLKPHIAFWIVLALLVMRCPAGRMLAWRACLLTALSLLVVVLIPGSRMQFASYLRMLAAETGTGSMSKRNHELILVNAQITSFGSLIGYWISQGMVLHVLEYTVLAAVLAILVWLTRRTEHGAWDRLALIGAWCAFGLIATYHRAHDGCILILLLPWILHRLRNSWKGAAAWTLLLLGELMSDGPSFDTYRKWAAKPAWHGMANFLLYRQAPLAVLLLMLLLLFVLSRPAAKVARPELGSTE